MKQSLKGAQTKGYSPTGPGEVRSIFITLSDVEGFSDGSVGKGSACNAGDTGDAGLIPKLGRSLGEENGNPLQYSCLENLMDIGTWQATVHRVTKSQT